MDKDTGRGTALGGSRNGKWNGARTTYRCADGVAVSVPVTTVRRHERMVLYYGDARVWTAYGNVVAYRHSRETKWLQPELFVSETEFDRKMLRILWGTLDSKTVAFPGTVREVADDAFQSKAVRSAVLNEGLEALGEYQNAFQDGVFSKTHLKRVRLPSTLLMLGCHTFA